MGIRSGLEWVGLDFRLFIDSVMGGWRCMVLFCLVVVVGVLYDVWVELGFGLGCR